MVGSLNLNNMSTQQHWSSHYLDQFVTNLASLLRVDTVYVSQFNHSTNTFSVLSNMARGVLNAEQDIDFDSLPCRETYRLGALEYNDNLLDAFPDQLILRDWLVQSYIGIQLKNRNGEPLGVLSVFFKRALSKHQFELNLIRLVADFLALEISQIEAEPDSQLLRSSFFAQAAFPEPLSAYRQWLTDNIENGRLTSWSYALDDDQLLCTDSFSQILEIPNLQKLQKLQDFVGLIAPIDKKSAVSAFYRAIRATTTTPIRCVFNLITENKKYKRIQNDIYPVFEAGTVIRLDCISKDITAEELSKKRAVAQERVLETILATTPIGLIKLDANLEINWVNNQACQMFGYTLEEFHALRGQKSLTAVRLNIYFPEELPKFEQGYADIYANKQNSFCLDTRYRHRDGSVLWAKVNITAIRNDWGEVEYFINTIQDLTEQVDDKNRLKLIENIYRYSSEGVMLCSADRVIVDVNPAFERITGFSATEAVGRTHYLLDAGVHEESFYDEIKAVLIAGDDWQGIIWSRNRKAEIFAQQVTLSGIFENGQLAYFFAVFSDVTDSKKSEQQIITKSNYDTLTALPNRQYFSSEIRQFIEKSAVNDKKFAILYIDIDDFKSVNNSENFQTGDQLLKDITLRLQKRCRQQDFLARIDGDEFAFIIPEVVNKRQAEVYAKQLQGAFAQAYKLGNQQRYITASVGITMFPVDGNSAESLMQNAEQAVFEAKRKGRNQCVTYSQKLSDAVQLKHHTLLELSEAIKRKQLDVYYQPIIDNVSGSVDKLEALVRWKHETRGFISPAEFIPLAEEGGLIQGVGELVLEQACHDLKQLQNMGYPNIEMSINRSILEFKTVDEQASEWLAVIASHQLDYSAITMEITESLLMDMDGQYMQRINALKDAGVKIAIDDFGTGYSSLNYLRGLPADIVKIDRSFILNIPENELDTLLLEGIIKIVHNLGMKVVTEGVETKEQLAVLKEKQCDYSQGFLLCRPIPLAELIELLQLPPSHFFNSVSHR